MQEVNEDFEFDPAFITQTEPSDAIQNKYDRRSTEIVKRMSLSKKKGAFVSGDIDRPSEAKL